jgi:GGDEF domain-containing protein
MEAVSRWFWVGSRADVAARLTEALGGPPLAGSAMAAADGDLVVVDALASGRDCAGLPGGHPFSAVRGLKERRGVAVYVVVPSDDRIGVQLARFCLADGVLRWNAGSAALDIDELEAGRSRGDRKRPSIDALLARVQGAVAASGRGESTVERLLRFEREDSLLVRLQDPETGLFDGPYATLKLDEEWKRARRFHQPLSLLLIDLGHALTEQPEAARKGVLADAAGVFLNECRDIDVLARFSSTTFLFLLPGTGSEGAEVLARRMLASLRERLAAVKGLAPACGLSSVPSSLIADRKAFLLVAEACLQRAQAGGGDGGLCTTWQ